MLEFMHCLADADRDKEDRMTKSVLSMLWTLAKEASDDTLRCSTLNAQLKILRLSCVRVKKWEVSICEGIVHYSRCMLSLDLEI